MNQNLLKREAEGIIKQIDKNNLAYLLEKDLPKGYKIKQCIPYWYERAFENGECPILLNGSRRVMWMRYLSPDRAAIELIWARAIKLFKITSFRDDSHNSGSHGRKRWEKNRRFIENFIKKYGRRYPRQRFDYMLYGDYILGESVYLSDVERTNVKKSLELPEQVLEKLSILTKKGE